ncbi:MAG: VWA domain-containing protein [Terriglobales bacterium]
MSRYLALVTLLLVSFCAASAQNAPQPQVQPRPAEPASAPPAATDRRITLDVQVTDKSGAPVRGLQKEDFTLLNDKQPQSIASFHAFDTQATPDTPLSQIILVVDAVNTPRDANSTERSEVRKFLLQNGGKPLPWPVSLVLLSELGPKMQDAPSRDGNALAALYDQYQTGLRGANLTNARYWGALERFQISLKGLASIVEHEKTQPGRKLVIWLSSGWPMLEGADNRYTAKDAQGFFDSITSFSTQLRQARITLYSVDPVGVRNAGTSANSYYESFLKGVPNAKKASPADLALQVLAVQGGGRVFASSNSVASAIGDCVADAQSFYVLAFDAAKPDQPNEYHALELKVDKPGATARTRTGYYAQP